MNLNSGLQHLYNVGVNKAKKPDRNSYFPCGFRNQYKTINRRRKLKFVWIAFCGKEKNEERNRTTERSQDYVQKPQRKCTFMNSIAGQIFFIFSIFPFYSLVVASFLLKLTSNKIVQLNRWVNWKSRQNLNSWYYITRIDGNCKRINNFLWFG
jgi:hypothetical protein